MSTPENDINKIDGERGAGITSVADEKRKSSKLGKRGVVVLIAIVGGVLLYQTWDGGNNKPKEDETHNASISPTVPFTEALTPRPNETAPVSTQSAVEVPSQRAAEPPADDNKEWEASIRAPVMAFSGNADQGSQPANISNDPQDFSVSLPAGLNPGGQQPQPRLHDKLQATPLEGVAASVLPNLHMVVPQGTQIPCILQTAVSSDQPGFVSCVIQRDVLSASGQVVLMEKGTSIIGEYEGGLKRGQKRIFVLWNRARTPRGVVVNLASPATDGLGRSGFDGNIDSHFWERFGGAMLMSVVSDATKYGFSRLKEKDGVETENTERSAHDAASIALENSINIPPTLYKNQGDIVSIFVARDLDFSSIYSLKTIEAKHQIFDRAVKGDMRRTPEIVTK